MWRKTNQNTIEQNKIRFKLLFLFIVTHVRCYAVVAGAPGALPGPPGAAGRGGPALSV